MCHDVPTVPNVVVVSAIFTDSFMKDDLRILRQTVDPLALELQWWPRRIGTLWTVARVIRNLLLFTYYLTVKHARAAVFWFAPVGYGPTMAGIAKLLGRAVIVITGGWDAVYLPDLDWGALKGRWHRLSFSALIRLADVVLPFSDASRATVLQTFRPRRITTVYPPIDSAFFLPGREERQRRVVTCCYAYAATQVAQKGLGTFVGAARFLPDVEFVLIGNAVGAAAANLQSSAPANVRFMARLPRRADYRDLLQSSSVYAQLSAHEGFGVSLAEAMACGCIPVVSNRYSLPEVVGDTGYVVPYGDSASAAKAIEQALMATPHCMTHARGRVIARFDKRLREEALRAELTHFIPALSQRPIRIELGCGSTGEPGTIGVDLRRTRQTKAVCDVRRSCFRSEIADEVYSLCVLEHLDNPYELMDEVVRILKPDGRAILRVPNIGTFSAHLDTTHRFLADLTVWKAIIRGYFAEVRVIPVGTKYRDNPLLRTINQILVTVCHFYEFAQGWTFVCSNKRPAPTQAYIGWWAEEADR